MSIWIEVSKKIMMREPVGFSRKIGFSQVITKICLKKGFENG